MLQLNCQFPLPWYCSPELPEYVSSTSIGSLGEQELLPDVMLTKLAGVADPDPVESVIRHFTGIVCRRSPCSPGQVVDRLEEAGEDVAHAVRTGNGLRPPRQVVSRSGSR